MFFISIVNARFDLGTVLVTPGVEELISPVALNDAFNRHAQGDWGDVDDEDRASNDASLRQGSRLLSVYKDGDTTFWIITEADRSATTALLPEEY